MKFGDLPAGSYFQFANKGNGEVYKKTDFGEYAEHPNLKVRLWCGQDIKVEEVDETPLPFYVKGN